MSSNRYISRLVNLEPIDHQAILKLAHEKGFGEKGFSASLRTIIREWTLMRVAFSKMQGKEKDLYADFSRGVFQSVSPEDKLLESGVIEVEFSSAESEPEASSTPKVPDSEYEAALAIARAGRFLKRS